MSDAIPSYDARRGRSGHTCTVAIYLSLCATFGVEPKEAPSGAVTARIWEGHSVEWLDAEGRAVR